MRGTDIRLVWRRFQCRPMSRRDERPGGVGAAKQAGHAFGTKVLFRIGVSAGAESEGLRHRDIEFELIRMVRTRRKIPVGVNGRGPKMARRGALIPAIRDPAGEEVGASEFSMACCELLEFQMIGTEFPNKSPVGPEITLRRSDQSPASILFVLKFSLNTREEFPLGLRNRLQNPPAL